MREPRVIGTGLGGISHTPRTKANRMNVDFCGRCGKGISAPRRGEPAFCKDCRWVDPVFCAGRPKEDRDLDGGATGPGPA